MKGKLWGPAALVQMQSLLFCPCWRKFCGHFQHRWIEMKIIYFVNKWNKKQVQQVCDSTATSQMQGSMDGSQIQIICVLHCTSVQPRALLSAKIIS